MVASSTLLLPEVMAIAGPNGPDKTTVSSLTKARGVHINADDIKLATHCADFDVASDLPAVVENRSVGLALGLEPSNLVSRCNSGPERLWTAELGERMSLECQMRARKVQTFANRNSLHFLLRDWHSSAGPERARQPRPHGAAPPRGTNFPVPFVPGKRTSRCAPCRRSRTRLHTRKSSCAHLVYGEDTRSRLNRWPSKPRKRGRDTTLGFSLGCPDRQLGNLRLQTHCAQYIATHQLASLIQQVAHGRFITPLNDVDEQAMMNALS